jgi:protease I
MKALMVVAQDLFRDEEYQRTKEVLEKAKVEVVTASKNIGIAKGRFGLQTKATLSLAEVRVPDFDAMIFIGGPGSLGFFEDQNALKIAKDAFAQKKIVAAICSASGILANAGVLNGKKATSFPREGELLTKKGASYTAQNLEVDGKIVTADGPDSAFAFGDAIVKLLKT